MRDSRRQQPVRSDRQQPMDRSGEHVIHNGHQGMFPRQNTMPMQPAVYHYEGQQQHIPNVAQMQPPFSMGSQMGNAPYNGVPMSGTMSGSTGPTPFQGVPQPGLAPGMVPTPQFEPVEQNRFAPAHYSRPLPNQAYAAFDNSGKPLSGGFMPSSNKPVASADATTAAGGAGYSGQYPADFLTQTYMGSTLSSDTGGTNEENVNKRKSSQEDDMQGGRRIPMTGQSPMATQSPMVSALRFEYLRKYQAEQALLQIYGIIDAINVAGPLIHDLTFWRKLSDYYFSPRASVRHTRKLGADYRLFEFAMPLLPIMWVTLSTLDVQKIEISMSQIRTEVLSNGSIVFHTPALKSTYYYSDGSYVTNHSQLKGCFNASLKIQWLDIFMYKFSPGIEWSSLERVLARPNLRLRNILKAAEMSGSEERTNNNRSVNEKPEDHNGFNELRSNFSVFKSIPGQGLHERLLRMFQVSDVMSTLSDLCVYQRDQKIKSPLEALDLFVKQNRDESTSNSMENIGALHPTDGGGMARGKSFPAKEDQVSVGSTPTACSPQDVRGNRPAVGESGSQPKRSRPSKVISRASKGSSSSTPTSESFDCNGIPGTKKIKF
ncbi:hypothetical protein HG536_0D00500 [Torulaspora globosa]|uniref:Morphogenetic regulator of filamentous growth protein 1 n=1 Tax=Torulaspora globosa TaxID=48254 RepID=A0A7G3ZG92_9SACH|nr:uncharacterized protein HG536_0D00500 [Torulaspora globosa]QLL32528.1 hypothetical protein HG536_0D00500 [Torulaspora globosa]